MANKRGDIPWHLVTIILAIVVLVVLFFGIWNVMKGPGNKFVNADKDNLGLVVQECKISCLSGLKSDYCEKREIYSGDEAIAGMKNCDELEKFSDDLSCDINC